MKMQNLKRLCAVVLSVLMIVSIVPASVFAAECVHEYEITSWLKEATCTAKGIAKETCKLCGDTKYASITSPHTESEPKLLEADCTNPDRISVICSVCNAELSMEAVEGGKAALGHDWGYMFPAAEGDTDTVKKYYEPTCDKEGYGVKYCKRCDQEGKNGVDSAVPALGEHTFGDAVHHDATCTEDEKYTETCTKCGFTQDAVVEGFEPEKAKGEHNDVLISTLKAAACTTSGVGKYDCDVEGCDKAAYYKTIPAGHTWGEYEVAKAATCGAEGEKTRACTACDAKETEKIPATGEHTYEDTIKDATCTENTVVGEICSVCGATGKVEILIGEGFDALGHIEAISYPAAEGDTDTVKKYYEPTCDKDGVAQIICSVCNTVLEETVEIPVIGHTEEIIPAVEATCTATGLTEGKKCSACGEILLAQEEIEAHGHKIVNVAGKPACTEEGLTAGKKCSECGLVTVAQEVIPAGTHTAKLVDSYPHESNGLTVYVYKCENCGHTTVMY